MKPKKGSATDPEIQKPDRGEAENWAALSEEETLKAERQVAARMASSIAIWAASLEIYQTMVRDWTKSRQGALWKSMKALSEIQSSPSSEGKAEEAADVFVEQWASFQRDFLALQMKTAAKAGALLGKAVEMGRTSEGETIDGLREAWKKAEGHRHANETFDK